MARQGRGNAITCRQAVFGELVKSGAEMTAYQLARKIGFTPRHCNRTLAAMWASGSVAYVVRMRGKVEKRVWALVSLTNPRLSSDGWVSAYERPLL